MKRPHSVAFALVFVVAIARPATARTPRGESPIVTPAGSENPNFLGRFKDWSAYMRGSGEGRVCYVLSEPTSKEPANVNRDPAYFLINDWPARRSRGEAEIISGYPYKDGSTVSVQIGSEKFDFFTKNERSAGSAWILDPADDLRLLRSLRGGRTATVTGTSRRSTLTKDVYSLAGVADALDRIHDACGM